MNQPRHILPPLPPDATTFTATSFGAYCPRGYNPNGISGRISGIPISYLTSGRWLDCEASGSGTRIDIADVKGALLGTVFVPSGLEPRRLTFTPMQQP